MLGKCAVNVVWSTFIGISLVKGSFLDRTRCTIAAHSFFLFYKNSVSRPRLEYLYFSVNLRLKYSYEIVYREGYGLLFYLIYKSSACKNNIMCCKNSTLGYNIVIF